MKWINLILGVLFILFAYFQLNDPDPYGWVAIYVLVAGICFAAAFDRYYLPIIILGLIVSMLWTLSLIPDFINWIRSGAETIVGSMKAEKPHIELTREFLGLALISATLFFQYKKGKKLNVMDRLNK